MEKRRARKEEEKQERRESLIETTLTLFEQGSYEGVTMAGVAARAGLAKGTVFLYFKTKEHLFLAVLEKLMAEWFQEIDLKLQTVQGSRPASQVISHLRHSLEGRVSLTRLLAILHTTLEQNIDQAATLEFKRFLGSRLETTGQLLERALAFLQPGQGLDILLKIDALIIGLYHLSNPTPEANLTNQEPGLEFLKVNFNYQFTETLRILFHGLEAEARPLH